MANQLGSLVIAPRSYTRHQRHRRFDRVKAGANQFTGFLGTQATRLSSTSAAVFASLAAYTGATQKSAEWVRGQS